MEPSPLSLIPRHVAVIMDGNGRWAKSRNRPRVFGHRSGAKRVRQMVEAAAEADVEFLTLYAFSEENWQRPADEVSALMKLLTHYLKTEIDHLHRNNVRLSGIGHREKLPNACRELLEQGEKRTRNNTGLRLTLALSYSARTDMIDAFRKIADRLANSELNPADINENMVGQHLSTHDLPDPDLLIRTSGEQRLSNFLLWELSYAELFFTEKNWPDFTKEDFNCALVSYGRRERRYGKVCRSLVEKALEAREC